MLKLSDLALRPDLQLGPMLVSPSRRLVEGPGGHAHLEPLIMQVLLLLLDARGKVVTRSELFDQCWGGVMVGDDSLNRAIARVRRTGAQVVPGLLEIETIPRTGYRLTGEILRFLNGAGDVRTGPVVSRRGVVAGGVTAAAALGGAGLWWAMRSTSDPRAEALVAAGDEALRNGTAFEDMAATIRQYEQAVRLQPDNAKAWGRLAYFRILNLEGASPEESARLVEGAEAAIRRATVIDPQESNALTARFLLQGPMLDWATRDRQLRDIVAVDASNILSLTELMTLLQATGFTRESWTWNERILGVAPLSRPHLVIRALKLWILGNIRASDNVIDRVRSLWPLYDFGFMIRLMLFALTGRPQAALSMIDNAPAQFVGAPYLPFWRRAAEALHDRSVASIEAARAACFEVAKRAPWRVNMAVQVMCALGETDAAFELTNGYLLWRGKSVSADQADGTAINDYNRRMTQWLFTPATAAMRADPRFLRLAEDFGLLAYWRARRAKPDYMLA